MVPSVRSIVTTALKLVGPFTLIYLGVIYVFRVAFEREPMYDIMFIMSPLIAFGFQVYYTANNESRLYFNASEEGVSLLKRAIETRWVRLLKTKEDTYILKPTFSEKRFNQITQFKVNDGTIHLEGPLRNVRKYHQRLLMQKGTSQYLKT